MTMIRSTPLAAPSDLRTRGRRWDWRIVAAAALYLILYVLLCWLSDIRPLLTLGISPWSPQAGLTLAFLMIYGPRQLPVTVAASLLAGILLQATAPASPWLLLSSLWIGLGYGGMAAVLRTQGLSAPLASARDAARMAGTVVAATLVVAAGYIGLFVVAGELPASDAWTGIARYWIGDLNGVLTLTPLLLLVVNGREDVQVLRKHRWEILAQFAAVALTLWAIFMLPVADQLRFFYLLFVPIVWIALRWSWPGALLAVLAIQIGLILADRASIPTARFIDLQFLMLTLTLTALLLGAVVAERASILERVAVREAEQRALLAMAPDAVFAIDSSGGIRLANAAAQRLFGERAIANASARLEDFLPDLHLDAPGGRAAVDGRRADRSDFPAEIAWARLDAPASQGFLVTVRDATDRRLAQEQLRERDAALARAMRFAEAGELASALAHELNQPITALVSYLRASQILAGQSVANEDRLRTTLDKAIRESIRASEVLRRLKDFYQGGSRKHEDIDIPSVCKTVLDAFQDRLRRAGATLDVDVDTSIPAVQGDATQLQIVLHNLLGNALDAVMQVPTGARRLGLYASRVEGSVVLHVEDSGPGVAAEVANRLFEPFITSKPDGMGLGLVISRSLVVARGGELAFAPAERLGGASFVVRLPIEIPPDTPRV